MNSIFKLAKRVNKASPYRVFCYDIGVKINDDGKPRIHDMGFVRMDDMYQLYCDLNVNDADYFKNLKDALEYFKQSSLLKYSEEITMIAHNNFGFDKIHLTRALDVSSLGIGNDNNDKKFFPEINHFDTLPFNRKLFPNEKGHSLKDISNRANIPYKKGNSLKDAEILSHVYGFLNEEFKTRYE